MITRVDISLRRFFALAISLTVVCIIATAVSAQSASANPSIAVGLSSSTTGGGSYVLVTATVTNDSADFTLEDVSADLSPASGASIINPEDSHAALGVVAESSSVDTEWLVHVAIQGENVFAVTATGTLDGIPFTISDSATVDVDATPPSLAVSSMPTWSTTTQPFFQWAGSDSQSAVKYDVEESIDGAPFSPLLTATEQTSISLPGTEGQNIRLRIHAVDSFDNASDWTEVGTTIDAVGPVASLGAADASKQGIRSVPLSFSNAGSPVTAKFTFADKTGGRTGSATNGQVVSFTNNGSLPVYASLSLVVTDALGRQATAQETYLIEPRLGPSGLKFKSAKRSGSKLVIVGAVSKNFSGKVSVVATRIGTKGTKRVAKSSAAKKGAFKVSLRLKPGRYKFVATTPKTTKFSATSITSKLTIK